MTDKTLTLVEKLEREANFVGWRPNPSELLREAATALRSMPDREHVIVPREEYSALRLATLPSDEQYTTNRISAADTQNRIEYGWVIEGAWSDPSTPEYWAGSSLWMADSLCAIRFAREHDARQAADAMLDGMNIRICEHAWTDPPRGGNRGDMLAQLQKLGQEIEREPDTRGEANPIREGKGE